MFTGGAITFGRLHTWTLSFYYQEAEDVLRIRAPWNQEGAWVDLPDGLQVKVDAQTGEASEFRIENFRSGFLAQRPDLAASYAQVKPSPIALRRMENTPFIHHFLEHVAQLANDRDEQLRPSSTGS